MARPRTLLTLIGTLPLSVLACTSSPEGSSGSGGALSTSGGGSAASGGTLGTGGASSGGASSGGASSGGASSGGASSGGGGLGGEIATGGSENSGGTVSDGGSGGSAVEPYGACDGALGEESNPDCDASEVCFHNTCMETCPTNLTDAATYDCRDVTSATPPSRCAFAFGRCELVCEGQGSLPDYDCPDGMDCVYARCVWP